MRRLKDSTHRFTYNQDSGRFAWKRHNEVNDRDIDCGNMSDAEFEKFLDEVNSKALNLNNVNGI